MALAKRTLEPPNAPRAHLDGLELGNNSVLPSLASVRADAVRSKEMQERPEDFEDIAFYFPRGSSVNAADLPPRLRLPLIFNNLVPNLFRFSYFVREGDVPEDIMNDCIWALSLFVRVMEECSEAVLRAVGHVKGGNDYRKSKYLTLINARGKLAGVGRALEAIPYVKAMVDEECSRGDDSWLLNPMPFELYGETLVLTRKDDTQALKTLRRAMLGIDSKNWPANGISQLIRTRIFLSRALRNLGEDDEAKTHETWLTTWFRKNPRLMSDDDLKYLLLPAGPILNGLGGESWLENRKQTAKTDERATKACRTCSAREPLVTLLQCNNCKHIYYCSKECQRENWKYHKVECREMAAIQQKIEDMRFTDPDGAKCAADWSSWCNSNHDATQFGLVHALGLHRDPRRGRTHIVVKQVEYAPAASKLKHKFRVVACGVFRVKDILRDLETIMRLDRGEGQEYVDSLFDELDGARIGPQYSTKVPFIDLSFGDGVMPWLGSGGATTTDSLHATSYNPNWRKGFNIGAPPGPMKLRCGAKDVEHFIGRYTRWDIGLAGWTIGRCCVSRRDERVRGVVDAGRDVGVSGVKYGARSGATRDHPSNAQLSPMLREIAPSGLQMWALSAHADSSCLSHTSPSRGFEERPSCVPEDHAPHPRRPLIAIAVILVNPDRFSHGVL
ncbi:hypothetical protein B0H17DRAFT_1206074 [Mycena rosella]|uniref:MYND-type domain-containing protein n=1 Tax=Mycena rosella TaxID=1033263 RepID=A0AAD7D5V1_MYCRO|nr:hypothetical protein B0H17DRAFT_1206074 [Mycena rosella]